MSVRKLFIGIKYPQHGKPKISHSIFQFSISVRPIFLTPTLY